jgi:hypothetical protein
MFSLVCYKERLGSGLGHTRQIISFIQKAKESTEALIPEFIGHFLCNTKILNKIGLKTQIQGG